MKGLRLKEINAPKTISSPGFDPGTCGLRTDYEPDVINHYTNSMPKIGESALICPEMTEGDLSPSASLSLPETCHEYPKIR